MTTVLVTLKEKWRIMALFRRGCLVIQAVLLFLFTILYFNAGRQQGIVSRDRFFSRSIQDDAMVYTGRQDGRKTIYKVWETDAGYTVECQVEGQSFGPYQVDRVSADGMSLGDWGYMDGGIEIWAEGELLFRGAYRRTTGNSILLDEKGEFYYDWGKAFDRPATGSIEPSNALTLFSFTVGAELTHRGYWPCYGMGLLIAALNMVTLLFPDELFRWRMSLRISRWEDAEPSAWERFGRHVGWILLLFASLFCFLVGLLATV